MVTETMAASTPSKKPSPKLTIAKTFGKNTIAHTFEQFVNVLLGFAVTIYIAREYGPALFGVWTLLLTALRISTIGAGYGLDPIIMHRCSADQEEANKFLTLAITLRLINALLVITLSVVALLLFWKTSPDNALTYLLLAIGILSTPFDSIEFWFRARKNAVVPAIVRIVSVSIGSALKILLIAGGFGLAYIGGAHTLQLLVGSVLFLFFFHGIGSKFYTTRRQLISQLRHLYHEGWPLLITAIGYFLYSRIDIIMLSYLEGTEAAGTYAAAVRVSEVANLAPVILMTAAAPFLFETMRKSIKSFISYFHLILTISYIFFALLAVFVFLTSNITVALIFGPTYSGAAPILAIHIFGLIFIAQGVISQYWWIARKRTKFLIWRAIVGCGTNIVLNIVLIPLYQGEGAAFATVVSQFISCVMIHWFQGPNGRHLFHMQTTPKLTVPHSQPAHSRVILGTKLARSFRLA